MIVRAAGVGDVAALAAVAAASYRAGFAGIVDAAELARRDAASFTSRFAASLAQMRLAARDGAVLGFSLVSGTHLDMLFVDPAAQGSGAGWALLADAMGRGVRSLECFRANAPARAFYARHGWLVTRGYSRPFAGRLHEFVYMECDENAAG